MSFTIEQFNQLKDRVKGKYRSTEGKKQETKPKKKYRSKIEELYANQLQARKLAGEIEEWFYEPITFKLADKLRYTPDFLVVSDRYTEVDGERIMIYEFVEIKGQFIRRAGIDKFKVARSLFPFFRFKMIVYSGGNWTEKYSDPNL